MKSKTVKNMMIELISEAQCNNLTEQTYDSLSDEEKEKYNQSSELIIDIVHSLPEKVRGRAIVTYEMIERVLGMKEGKILTIQNHPDSCSISVIHCDEDSSLPIKEGNLIPVTDRYNKLSKIHMCETCKDRGIAESLDNEFELGETVEVFVDGMGMKEGVVTELGSAACRVQVDNWDGVFANAMILKKEIEDDESEVSEL